MDLFGFLLALLADWIGLMSGVLRVEFVPSFSKKLGGIRTKICP